MQLIVIFHTWDVEHCILSVPFMNSVSVQKIDSNRVLLTYVNDFFHQLIEAEWYICDSKVTIIGSDYGLFPGRCQAIIWTNVGILVIGLLETNFNEILIEIHTFSFKKTHLNISCATWRPFCLGFNFLTHWDRVTHVCVWAIFFFPGNDYLLNLKPLGEIFSGIWIKVQWFSLKKMYLELLFPSPATILFSPDGLNITVVRLVAILVRAALFWYGSMPARTNVWCTHASKFLG